VLLASLDVNGLYLLVEDRSDFDRSDAYEVLHVMKFAAWLAVQNQQMMLKSELLKEEQVKRM
jgi:hypothetical protein